MVDLPALRSAAPGLLDRAASDWQALGGRFGSQVAALHSEVVQPLFGEGAWTGQAADAASRNLEGLSQQLSATYDYTRTMSSLLRDAANGIRNARALLDAAENIAAANKLIITADGSVTEAPMPPLAGGGPADPMLIQAPSPAAAEVADLIRRALTLANEVDARVTAGLQQLRGFASQSAAAQQQAADRLAGTLDRSALPSAGTNPAEANAWWMSLSTSQQQAFIHEFPGQIGWMNGLPAAVRDQANRLALAQERQSLSERLASLRASEPPQYSGAGRFGPTVNPAWQQWQAQVSGIETKLAGISAVEHGLSYAGSRAGAGNVFLLGFDANGNGHAIVAVGNPDSATNTVTYVPGLGSKLTGATGDVGRATALWQEATKMAPPGQRVSSIYWLGYNAPQLGLNLGIHNLDVTSTADAAAGGQALSQFQAGLQAAHQPGVPSHTVVLGHSYGSLVVGEAAAHDGLHPNDIIVVGSPGMGVNNVSQLGMPAGHVWAGANSHDPVPKLPPFNPLTALGDPNASHFGDNPATAAFGGRVFNANDDPSRHFSGIDLSAHSAYWDPGSSSLFNMAHIVDGQYNDVSVIPSPPPTFDPGPLLGPGIL